MPDADRFEIPYPCFFPVTGHDERLVTITIDGTPAVVFFTDGRLANRFFEDPAFGLKKTGRSLIRCDNHAVLLGTARDIELRMAPAGVHNIAVNPMSGGCGYVSVREFIEYLEKSK